VRAPPRAALRAHGRAAVPCTRGAQQRLGRHAHSRAARRRARRRRSHAAQRAWQAARSRRAVRDAADRGACTAGPRCGTIVAMMLHEGAGVSAAVGATRSRSEKTRLLVECLRALGPDERETGVAWLAGVLPGGKVNLGPATIYAAKVPAASAATLT